MQEICPSRENILLSIKRPDHPFFLLRFRDLPQEFLESGFLHFLNLQQVGDAAFECAVSGMPRPRICLISSLPLWRRIKNAKDNATGRQAFDLISLQPKEKVQVEMLPTFLDERQELVVGQLANTLVRQ